MKVFLNDRMVEFVGTMPDTISPRDLVVQNPTADSIKIVYEEFERNEKWGRMLIINSPSDSFFRLFKRIDAAGGLVKNEKGEFLFIHRFGLWDLPKGKIDKKDQHPGSIVCHLSSAICHPSSAYNAAVREVKEETGLQSVIITKELPSTWHIYSQKGKKILKQTFWFEMEADSAQPLKPQTNEGIFLVKWTPVDAINSILDHTYASLREMILSIQSEF